jgi:serine/threonine protein kinase/Flp pilus assembly protein TadD
MTLTSPDHNPLERLAAEWRERLRRGERPELAEYTAQHPELADQVRELFEAVVLLEDLKPGAGDLTGSFGPAALLDKPFPCPERLGDYRILREIGRGGMGVVYEAEQESLSRRVALKVLPAQALADPQQQKRFQREAKAVARLHHSNIVPVFGVGEHDGTSYYVMQYIQGLGLDLVLAELKRLRSGQQAPSTPAEGPQEGAAAVARSLVTGRFPMPGPGPDATSDVSAPPTEKVPSEVNLEQTKPPSSVTLSNSQGRSYWHSVARIGIQVADALEYASSQGILHRDIKPSNLLLDTQGQVWVTDFGLAKVTVEADNLTHTGEIVGTLRYLPPERFQGRSDIRGDICSLGLTLYELLTLRPAFGEEDRFKLVQQVMHQDPLPPRQIDRSIPRDLETIVLKAIARDPEQRYQRPADLAEDLRRFVEDRPIRARRAPLRERLWRWCRRNPAVAGLGAALVVVFLLGFAGVVWKWREAEQSRREADLLRQDAEERSVLDRDGMDRLNEANRLMNRGRRRIDNKQWAEAAADLTRAVDLRPDNALLWAERRQLYMRLGLWQEAARDAAREFELQPPDDDPKLRLDQGALRLYIGDTPGYRQACRRALEQFGQTTDPFQGGWVVRLCTLAEGAVPDPVQLVQIASRDGDGQLRRLPWRLQALGIAEYRAGQFNRAVQYLGESQKQEPAWFTPMAWPPLALAHHRLGQQKEAEKALAEADRWLDRSVPWKLSRDADRLPLPWWDWFEFRFWYHEAVAQVRDEPAEDHPKVHVLRSQSYAALGQWDEAVRHYTRAVELRSSDPVAWLERGRLLADAGRWDQARADFARAVELKPEDAALWAERGRIAAQYGHWAEAAADFGPAIQHGPKNVTLRLERGRASAALGRWEQVAEDFCAAIDLTPTDAGKVVGARTPDGSQRSRVYSELARWDAAFEEAMRRRPEDRRFWLERARRRASQGLWAQAAADYARWIGEQPTGDVVEYACVQLLAGDTTGYRQTCARLLERYGATQEPYIAYTVARACMLSPQGTDDPARLPRLAELELRRSLRDPWTYHVYAAALYRAGQFEQAIRVVETGLTVAPNWTGHFVNWPLLALAHHQLGQEDQAFHWLDNSFHLARQAEQNPDAQRDSQFYRGASPDWLEFEVLRREAESVLNVKHRREAEEAHHARRWEDAIRHLDALLAADPTHWPDWRQRGSAHAHLGHWDKASADFARAAELRPDDSHRWYILAAAQLGAENEAGHRRTCSGMLERFGKTRDPRSCNSIAYACVVLPDAIEDKAALVRAAEAAVPWFRGNERVLGAALVRAGRYEDALKSLQQAEVNFGGAKAWDLYFRALALHHLGRTDEARQCLDRAAKWIAEADRQEMGTKLDQWVEWHEIVEVGYLRREAEKQIKGPGD